MNYKKTIPLLIAALGFTVSCDDDGDDDGNGSGIQLMYGTQSAEYKQKSMVEQAVFINNEEEIIDE